MVEVSMHVFIGSFWPHFRTDILIISISVICIILEAITINRVDYIAEHLVFVRSLKLLRFVRLKNRYYTFIRIVKVLMLRLFRQALHKVAKGIYTFVLAAKQIIISRVLHHCYETMLF